jgi:hypothetical protein
VQVGRGRETHWNQFRRLGEQFVGLGFRDAFHGEQLLFRAVRNRLHREESGFVQLLYVCRRNAGALNKKKKKKKKKKKSTNSKFQHKTRDSKRVALQVVAMALGRLVVVRHLLPVPDVVRLLAPFAKTLKLSPFGFFAFFFRVWRRETWKSESSERFHFFAFCFETNANCC